MSRDWTITTHVEKLPALHKPLFIEGLPGIGSVTKIALDFIVSETKAEKLLSFSSHAFPPSVFVNEQNLVDLPSISLYYTRAKPHDLLFLSGDLQPVTEIGCHSFAHAVLDEITKLGVHRIITLGGVALNSVPKEPKMYCTGNDTAFIREFSKDTPLNPEPYGIIGPIVGISGLLLGLAKQRNIPALTILVETYAHPMYLGIDGSRALIQLLAKKLGLTIDMERFETEIEQLQRGMDQKPVEGHPARSSGSFATKVNYIG